MSKKYFINNVDSLIGKNILAELNKMNEDGSHMATFKNIELKEKP